MKHQITAMQQMLRTVHQKTAHLRIVLQKTAHLRTAHQRIVHLKIVLLTVLIADNRYVEKRKACILAGFFFDREYNKRKGFKVERKI